MAIMAQQRRNYLIDKRFQLRFTFSIAALLLTVVFLSGFGLYMGMWGAIIENFSKFKVSENLENVKRIAGYEEARYPKGDFRLERIFREAELLSEREQETLHGALESVNKALAPKVLILALLVFAAGIFASHKIAGPLYRFEKSADAIKAGDLSVNFKIRRDDEIKKTASKLEEMLNSIRGDVKKVKTLSLSLKEALGPIDKDISQEGLKRLRGISDEMNSVLYRYQI